MRPEFLPTLFVALAASTALTAEALASAPRYKMVLGEEQEKGVKMVSLVATPAIQVGWVALSEQVLAQAKRVHLASEAHKQIVTGPALIPGLEILRLSKEKEPKPFYIRFDEETIELAMRRFAREGQHSNTNQDHSIALEGNTVVESWLVTDPANDKATALGFDVPAGTWMLSVHIPDADYWQKEIVSGNKTGFSIEGLFDPEALHLSAVAPPTPTMKKTWLNAMLISMSALIPGAKQTKVILKSDEIIDLAEDGAASSLDEHGNIIGPLADGSYELPDGTALVVKDGKKEVPATAGDEEGAAGSSDAAKEPETTQTETQTAVPVDLSAVAPEALKLHAEKLFLEAVPMADGSELQYNPVTRRLSDSTGKMVESGVYACKDGSYFQVDTSQYTYTIDAATYDRANTKLEAVQLELADAKELLSKAPAGAPLSLGGDLKLSAEKPVAPHLQFLAAHTAQ